MRVLGRLGCLSAAFLVGILGIFWLGPPASAAPTPSGFTHVYTYDEAGFSTTTGGSTRERGPSAYEDADADTHEAGESRAGARHRAGMKRHPAPPPTPSPQCLGCRSALQLRRAVTLGSLTRFTRPFRELMLPQTLEPVEAQVQSRRALRASSARSLISRPLAGAFWAARSRSKQAGSEHDPICSSSCRAARSALSRSRPARVPA